MLSEPIALSWEWVAVYGAIFLLLEDVEKGFPLLNVEIEFMGFPTIYNIFRDGSRRFSFSGDTLRESVEALIKAYGDTVKTALQNPIKNDLDPTIQIMVNGKCLIKEDLLDQRLTEGDKITFLKLLSGG
jgi:sulfur carrier protein ThiS